MGAPEPGPLAHPWVPRQEGGQEPLFSRSDAALRERTDEILERRAASRGSLFEQGKDLTLEGYRRSGAGMNQGLGSEGDAFTSAPQKSPTGTILSRSWRATDELPRR